MVSETPSQSPYARCSGREVVLSSVTSRERETNAEREEREEKTEEEQTANNRTSPNDSLETNDAVEASEQTSCLVRETTHGESMRSCMEVAGRGMEEGNDSGGIMEDGGVHSRGGSSKESCSSSTPPDVEKAECSDAESPSSDEWVANDRKCMQESSSEFVECRICLERDLKKSLVRPCSCQGSVAYAHFSCLKQWIRERGQSKCEICKSGYAAELLPDLQEDLEAGRAAQAARYSRGSMFAVALVGQANATDTSGNEASSRGEEHPEAQETPRRFWFRLMVFGGIFSLILICLLFLGLYAGDAVWAGILLRIIAFGIPIFIIAKALQVCWDIRRLSVAERTGRRPEDNV